MKQEEFTALMALCNSWEKIISGFQTFLSSLPTTDANASGPSNLPVTRALTSAASLRLHSIYAACGIIESQARSVVTAQWLLQYFGGAPPNPQLGHPMTGTMIMIACQTLIDEICRTRSLKLTMGHEAITDEEVALRASLTRGIAVMTLWAAQCPLVSAS